MNSQQVEHQLLLDYVSVWKFLFGRMEQDRAEGDSCNHTSQNKNLEAYARVREVRFPEYEVIYLPLSIQNGLKSDS